MNRTIARQSLAGITATALGLGMLGLAAAPASAAADCTTDCIGSVTRTIAPEQATLAFGTTAEAAVRVTFAPHGWSGGGSQSVTSFGTSHTAATGILTQGKSYRYTIVASDIQGASWQETGYFTTPVRTLSIDWGTVAVTNDSDTLGDGEIGAAGLLQTPDDQSTCQWKGLSPFPATGNTFRATASSSTPIPIDSAANLMCTGVGSSMHLAIQMIDNDKDLGDDCSPPPGYPWTHFGDPLGAADSASECWDWTYAVTTLTFPQAAAAVGTTTHGFVVATPTGTHVGYSANGTVTFTVATPAASLPATATSAVLHSITLDGSKNMVTGAMPRIHAQWAAPNQYVSGLVTTVVRLRKKGGAWLKVEELPISTTQHEFTGLEAGAEYEVQISSRDGMGLEHGLTVASATAQGAPGAPLNLVATPGEASVGLTWQPGPTNGSTVTGYRVRFRVLGEPTLTVLPIEPGTSRTVTGLGGGTPYEFYVEAYTSTDDIGGSAQVNATPLAPAAASPAAPSPEPTAGEPGAPAAPAAPQVIVTTGAKKKDGRARALVSGWSPQVASVVVAWCDTRISGKACAPTTARKRGRSGPLAADGTLELKLTKKRASTFNGTATTATFGGIKARRADRIRFQVLTTWADGRVEASPIQKVRL